MVKPLTHIKLWLACLAAWTLGLVSADAQDLSLMERDQLLKGIYYYQMKISPQVRRLHQVHRQLQFLLADEAFKDRSQGIKRAVTDKDAIFKNVKELYENFEDYYNFKIGMKNRYIPEVEVAKNNVIGLVNRAIGLKKEIENLVAVEQGGGDTKSTLPGKPLPDLDEEKKVAPPKKPIDSGARSETDGKDSSSDLMAKIFESGGDEKKAAGEGAGEKGDRYLDQKLAESAEPPPGDGPPKRAAPTGDGGERTNDKAEKGREDLFAYEKKFFGSLDSEHETNGITFTGSLAPRFQVQKETRNGDTLGRDFAAFKLHLLWNASPRWQVNFLDDFKAQYFINHWVRNDFGIHSHYQHSPSVEWEFASDLITNYFTQVSDLNYNTYVGYIDFFGRYNEHDEINARVTTEYEWYPSVSFNDLWRFRGQVGYNTIFTGGGRFHVDGGGYHENLTNNDRFDNNNFTLNGGWYRQFDSGETWSLANYLSGRMYDEQNSTLYVSNWWDDNFIAEYHHPLTDKTEFSSISDFYIRNHNVLAERDYYETRGRLGINHRWREDHLVDTGLSGVYHDDGFDGKSHYKIVFDCLYRNRVSENLLLEVTENFEARQSISGDLLDSYGNDFILNLTWFFSRDLYPGFRLGSILKEYHDLVFTDFSKFLVGANLKYKFGQRGVATLGTDLFPTWYRNGNTTWGDHHKLLHKTELKIDTPLSNSWSMNLTARAENRFDTFFSSLSDELLEDYYTELDVGSIDLGFNVIF